MDSYTKAFHVFLGPILRDQLTKSAKRAANTETTSLYYYQNLMGNRISGLCRLRCHNGNAVHYKHIVKLVLHWLPILSM